jgi:amidase
VAEFIFGIVQELVVSRTVRDTAAALDATSKPAVGDPFVIVQPERPYLQEVGAPAGTLRVGLVSSHWSGKKYDCDVAEALDAAAKQCEELGHHVEPVHLEVDEQLFFGGVGVYFGAFISVYVEFLAKQMGRKVDFDLIELQNAMQLQAFEGVDYTDVFLADLHLNAVRRNVAAVFENYDLLLMPTKGTLPEKLDVLDPNRRMSDAERMELWSSMIGCTTLFNITGNPAISLPLGQSASGLPIGIQLVAPFGDEATLIRMSSALEEAMPWRQRRPPVHVSA